LAQYLTLNGIAYKKIIWGGQCFGMNDRKMYVNKRAQAYVSLQRAIADDRFKIRTLLLKAKIEEQMTRVPYTFDDMARYKILSKEEMKRKGIKSPDLLDTFAFMFLSGTTYTVADDGVTIDYVGRSYKTSDEVEKDSILAEADEYADLLS
ncbi:terminase, partial [Acinetobacter baumannii]